MPSKTRRRFRFRRTRKQRGAGNTIINTLHVSYANKNIRNNRQRYTNTRQEPRLTLRMQPDKLYTLAMFDTDAPSVSANAKTIPGFLHWLFVNLESDLPQPYKAVFPYYPPEPPSGTHIYQFTLYEQPTRLVDDLPTAAGPFDLDAFIAAKGLKFVARKSMEVGKDQ